jgi:hypothetical protein
LVDDSADESSDGEGETSREPEDEVQEIVGHKIDGFGTQYKVRWKGYGHEADSWEPEANLHCEALILAFWAVKQLTGPWSKIAKPDDYYSSGEDDCVEMKETGTQQTGTQHTVPRLDDCDSIMATRSGEDDLLNDSEVQRDDRIMAARSGEDDLLNDSEVQRDDRIMAARSGEDDLLNDSEVQRDDRIMAAGPGEDDLLNDSEVQRDDRIMAAGPGEDDLLNEVPRDVGPLSMVNAYARGDVIEKTGGMYMGPRMQEDILLRQECDQDEMEQGSALLRRAVLKTGCALGAGDFNLLGKMFGWSIHGQRIWLALKDGEGVIIWAWQVVGKGAVGSRVQENLDTPKTMTWYNFATGCMKGLAGTTIATGHAHVLRIVCHALATELHESFELLRVLLNLEPAKFTNAIEPYLSPRYEWKLETPISNSMADTIECVDSYSEDTSQLFNPHSDDNMFMFGCGIDVFTQILLQCAHVLQVESRESPELMEALLPPLCTIKETDFNSLNVTSIAEKKIYEFDGIEDVTRECLEQERCDGKCKLSQALAHTFKQNDDGSCAVNVNTFRTLGTLFPELLDNSERDETDETRAAWLIRNKELILGDVVGVKETIFAKWLSLVMVGEDECAQDFEVAWDTRIAGRRLMISQREKILYARRFGFPVWTNWLSIAKALHKLGLKDMADVANEMHGVLKTRLQDCINNRRSAVAVHFQSKYPRMLHEMCDHLKVPRSISNLNGLRECIRLMSMVSSLKEAAFNHPEQMLQNRVYAYKLGMEHTRAVFASLGRKPQALYLARNGDVFVQMSHLLAPKDTAYFWDHASAVVKLGDMPVLETLRTLEDGIFDGEVTIYVGHTEWNSYQAAAADSKSLQHLFAKIGAETMKVCSWIWSPVVASKRPEWAFQLCKTYDTGTLVSLASLLDQAEALRKSEQVLRRTVPRAWKQIGFMMPDVTLRVHECGTCYYEQFKMPTSLCQRLAAIIARTDHVWQMVFGNRYDDDGNVKYGCDRSTGALEDCILDPFLVEMTKFLSSLDSMMLSNPVVLDTALLRCHPMGSIKDALKRVQAEHMDLNQTIYDEVGPVCSVFCLEEDLPRIIKVENLDTNQRQLLVMRGGYCHVLHGRWRHAGWSLPKRSGKAAWQDNVCMFMYVLANAEGSRRTRPHNGKHWKNGVFDRQQGHLVCYKGIGDIDDDATPLALPMTTIHGQCHGCRAVRPVYEIEGEEHEDCAYCVACWWEHAEPYFESDLE